MKKIVLFGLFLGCFIFAGCVKQQLGEGGEFYAENLIIAGVGPEISFEPTVEDGTLVLKGYFENHSDHMFLNQGIWEEYLKNNSDYLPGNEVIFKGVVESLDGAAGNHYYNVKSVENLEVKKYPNADEIKNLFEGYNYCEKDSDCGYFLGECPLGCYIPLNIKYIDIASNIVTNFVNHLGDERCMYNCMAMNKAVCNNYKCEMIDAPAEADVHGCSPLYKDSNFEQNNPELACDDSIYSPACANDGKTYKNDCFACKEPLVETFTFGQCENDSEVKYCTAFQKNADICTMQYEPVCGSDFRTYGNSCVACQSETVESYTMGECESSAFSVEGDNGYLQEVMEILENDGAVSCDYSYDDNGETVYGRFMADGNRFYSDVENQDYVLATGDKTYFWSSSSASEKTVIDSPADVESGIASLLMDKGNYSDFQINCSGGIEDENLFNVN